MSTTPSITPDLKGQQLNFENTEVAFRHRSDADLNRAYYLFKMVSIRALPKIGPPLTKFLMGIGLPLESLIKKTIFRHFCGGETIEECEPTVEALANGNVGSILDYSIEGEDDEKTFEATAKEIMRTIERAAGDARVPLSVFKATGIARFALLEKVQRGEALSSAEEAEFAAIRKRVDNICQLAHKLQVPVMIDAEETWIQDPVDQLAMEMMRKYNRERVIVVNTYQLYRNDKLASLKSDFDTAQREGFLMGAKLVRGAYMERERERAQEMGYPSPINPDKEATDRDYNEALRFCLENSDKLCFVAGTHNEASSRLLAELLHQKGLAHDHPHVYFSQLLGMSDHLSFNLGAAGYNVVKYVPYGPVKAVMPYLFRRAEENTSVAGQMGRELRLLSKEKKRRQAATRG